MDVAEKIITVSRTPSFKFVIDSSFGADIISQEIGAYCYEGINKKCNLPTFISEYLSRINFIEKNY